MDHIPPVKFFIPKVNIIREIPQSADTVPPGLWFYSKNPAVTPEVIETLLSSNYRANRDSRIVRNRELPNIVPIPADKLTSQEREHLLSRDINLICVVPSFGIGGLVLWGNEVKGVPDLGMHSLVLAASIAVWVRKLARTLVGKVAVESELEITWQQVKVIVEQQMHDFQLHRLVYDFKVELLVPGAQNRGMDPVLVSLEPGAEMDEQPIHEGEEFGYVIAGKLQLKLDDKVYTVGKDECFYFASDRRHSVKNVGKGAAKLLWVVTPPTFYY